MGLLPRAFQVGYTRAETRRAPRLMRLEQRLLDRFSAAMGVLGALICGCFPPPPRPPIIPATISDAADAQVAADFGETHAGGSGESCETSADCGPPATCRAPALCDSGTKRCVYAPLDGGDCNDGNPCMLSGTCVAGACVAEPKDCADGVQCTVDTCGPLGDCFHEISGCACTKDADCDDGDPCTLTAACEDLSCVGGEPLDCSALDLPCHVGSCDPATADCVRVRLPDDSPCDDNQACTLGDSCQGGTCVGANKACDDGNQCTNDYCDSATGACVHSPLSNGDACDDADSCTVFDSCNFSSCAGVSRGVVSPAWVVQFEGPTATAKMMWGGSVAGGATIAVELGAPSVFGFSTSQWLITEPQSRSEDGAYFGGLWLVAVGGGGELAWHRTLGGSGDLLLRDAVFGPAGEAFLLVERSGTLEGTFPFEGPLLDAPSDPGAALVAVSASGDLMWVAPIPPELERAALFYTAGPEARVGAVVRHAAQVTLIDAGSRGGPTLPAASSGSSLAAVTWDAVSGQLRTLADIGGLSDAALDSPFKARGAEDGSFVVALNAEGPAWLGGQLAPPFTPSGLAGALVGAFTGDASTGWVVTADGPQTTQVVNISLRAESGLLAVVASATAVAVVDSEGEADAYWSGLGGGFLPPLCPVRFSPAGLLMWPVHCHDVSVGLVEVSLDGDGKVLGSGIGNAVTAPTGATFSLNTSPKEPLGYLVRLTPSGDIEALGTLDSAAPCKLANIDPGGAIFCDGAKSGRGTTRTLTRMRLEDAPTCPP